jgi:hypothetical protein
MKFALVCLKIALISVFLNAPCRAALWIAPAGNLRYDQTCFLTAHNAFSNMHEGWQRYMQQTLNIAEQLDFGVRAFMLDVHEQNGSLILRHGSGPFCALQRGVFSWIASFVKVPNYKMLEHTLSIITQWMVMHPDEIITIFLENLVANDKLAQEIRGIKGFMPLVMSLNDWDPEEHEGRWPTLQWMRDQNKRIVIFNEDKTGSNFAKFSKDEAKKYPFYYLWHYIIESQYGTLHKPALCAERSESYHYRKRNRKLFLLNYFGRITRSSRMCKKYNSYENLSAIVKLCQKKGMASGKAPNFIALDFIDEGNALRLVNEINEKIRPLT